MADATDASTVHIVEAQAQQHELNVEQQAASADQVVAVLSSADITLHVLVCLWKYHEFNESNGRSLPNLSAFAAAAAVNRTFAHSSSSNCLWRQICESVWSFRFGFDKRMARGAGPHGWRVRFRDERDDAKRTSITASELRAMRFDFRFWFRYIFPRAMHTKPPVHHPP